MQLTDIQKSKLHIALKLIRLTITDFKRPVRGQKADIMRDISEAEKLLVIALARAGIPSKLYRATKCGYAKGL